MKTNNLLILLSFFVILLSQVIAQDNDFDNENNYNNHGSNNLNVQCTNFNDPTYYNFTNPLYNRIPICYIKVNNASQVRDALLYAKSLNKGVSIRSGGHSGCAFSILNNTINIDLSGLKDIYVNVEEKTVTIQAGANLYQMYNATTKHLLATAGGSCPTVGMGIALGGGSNNLAGKFGYMVDNILEMTVLLENGNIVKANPKNEYKDLYYAMAGAGHGGFGIAIDYKLRLYPIQQYFYKNSIRVINFYDIPKAITLLDQYVNSATQQTKDNIYVNIYSFVNAKSANNTPIATVGFFYNGPISEGQVEFEKLLSGFICPNTTVTNSTCTPIGRVTQMDPEILKKTYWEIVSTSAFDNNPRRQITKGRYVKKMSKAKVGEAFMSIYQNAINNVLRNPELLPEPNLSISAAFYYHGGKQNRFPSGSDDQPFNSFIHRGKKALYTYVLVAQYDNIQNDQIFGDFKAFLNTKLPSFGNMVYNNYPDDQIENWQDAMYGKHHYPLLQQIKKKYDPKNYFNYPQSIELPKKKNHHH